MGRPTGHVRSELAKTIPGAAGSAAILLLEETEFPGVDAGSVLEERVHLALVKTTREPWPRPVQPSPEDKFLESLDLGLTDWRDLLMNAGLANADWPAVLARVGLRPPTL